MYYLFIFSILFSVVFGFVQKYLFNQNGRKGIVFALIIQFIISLLIWLIIFGLTVQVIGSVGLFYGDFLWSRITYSNSIFGI